MVSCDSSQFTGRVTCVSLDWASPMADKGPGPFYFVCGRNVSRTRFLEHIAHAVHLLKHSSICVLWWEAARSTRPMPVSWASSLSRASLDL